MHLRKKKGQRIEGHRGRREEEEYKVQGTKWGIVETITLNTTGKSRPGQKAKD